jgi:hypothetical protein
MTANRNVANVSLYIFLGHFEGILGHFEGNEIDLLPFLHTKDKSG